jgi:hypothetical protein
MAFNNFLNSCQGSIYWKIPPPPLWGEISADVIWGKKFEKAKRKRRKRKNKKKKEERVKKKKERVKKMRKGEVKG